MGMFDHVYCEIPLPDGFTGEMQTKDFVCGLRNLLIRANGRLMIEDCDWEDVPLEERPNPRFPFLGSHRAINKRWRDLDFHGDFRFYGTRRSDSKLYEYCARFTHGALESIDAIPEDARFSFEPSTRPKKVPDASASAAAAEAGSGIVKASDDVTPGCKLDEIIAALPDDRRRKMESRAAELIAEAAKELDDFRADLIARKGSFQ